MIIKRYHRLITGTRSRVGLINSCILQGGIYCGSLQYPTPLSDIKLEFTDMLRRPCLAVEKVFYCSYDNYAFRDSLYILPK